MPDRRLYLDNAATSFPKPDCVLRAMVEYATHIGASPGRGAYAESREGAKVLQRCRERLCRLIGGAEPSNLIFTLNASDALNMAIWGAVSHARRTNPGRPIHLVATAMDHNSVLRPFNALAAEGVDVTFVDADERTGLVDPAAVAAAIHSETLLVAVVHASNVTGVIQPIEVIAPACRAAGCVFLVDAAQTVGHLPIDVQRMGIDLLAFPGHKGLLGPLGTGGLYIRPGIESSIDAIRQGGTGTVSESDTHPQSLPEKFEPGSHNMPGIAGLDAATGYLLETGVDGVRSHELDLMALMLDGLKSLEDSGLRLLGSTDLRQRVGVFSVAHESISPTNLAKSLEADFGILTRAGIHCAPRAHQAMGTLRGSRGDGTTRLSFGPFVTEDDVRYVIESLTLICGKTRVTAS